MNRIDPGRFHQQQQLNYQNPTTLEMISTPTLSHAYTPPDRVTANSVLKEILG